MSQYFDFITFFIHLGRLNIAGLVEGVVEMMRHFLKQWEKSGGQELPMAVHQGVLILYSFVATPAVHIISKCAVFTFCILKKLNVFSFVAVSIYPRLKKILLFFVKLFM